MQELSLSPEKRNVSDFREVVIILLHYGLSYFMETCDVTSGQQAVGIVLRATIPLV